MPERFRARRKDSHGQSTHFPSLSLLAAKLLYDILLTSRISAEDPMFSRALSWHLGACKPQLA
jgi:hypothetical protein